MDDLNQTTPETTVVEVPVLEGSHVATPESHWADSLTSEELRANQNIRKFKTLDDYAAWQSNASKLMGKKRDELSADDFKQFFTPEELIQAAQASGLPKSVEEYELPSLASHGDPSVVLKLKEIALSEGVTPKQMETLIKYNQEVSQELHARQKEQWTNDLLATYGDKAGEEMELAKQAASKYCSPELIKQLEAAGMGHNPEVIKAFAKVAREMLPDHIPRGSSIPTDTKRQIETDINQLIRDPDFNQRWKRGDHKATAQLKALYEKLEG
jgi:hypothetical protein